MPATFCRYRLWLGILYEIYSAIGHVSHFKTKETKLGNFFGILLLKIFWEFQKMAVETMSF